MDINNKKIPVLNANKLIVVENETIDYYYAITDERLFNEKLQFMKEQSLKFSEFEIGYDFKHNTLMDKKEWRQIENISIFINKEAKDTNSIIEGNITGYECVFLFFAKK